MSFIKAIFDISMLAILGEKVADGVSCTEGNGVCNVEINIDSDKLIQVLSGKKVKKLRYRVKNYKEAWNEICETIRLYNVALAIRAFGEALPTVVEMKEQMNAMEEMLSKNESLVKSAVEYETKEIGKKRKTQK